MFAVVSFDPALTGKSFVTDNAVVYFSLRDTGGELLKGLVGTSTRLRVSFLFSLSP